jgi:CubicO group peptidase (beta-lactamase class C family)
VTVVKDGAPALMRGYGFTDIRTRAAVTAATPFNIASLTKPFTSLVATQLVREGKLTLDAPAQR